MPLNRRNNRIFILLDLNVPSLCATRIEKLCCYCFSMCSAVKFELAFVSGWTSLTSYFAFDLRFVIFTANKVMLVRLCQRSLFYPLALSISLDHEFHWSRLSCSLQNSYIIVFGGALAHFQAFVNYKLAIWDHQVLSSEILWPYFQVFVNFEY